MRVVQFGEGVFLRGFFDWMVHRLNHEAGADIRVTLVQPRDSDGVARLMRQGGRYGLTQQGVVAGELKTERFVIDCIDAGLNTHEAPEAFEALARDPDVAVVVSNTTEAGISWSEPDAALALDMRAVRSFPGKLTWFLATRFSSPAAELPLFILPCELIADNGQALRAMVLRMAAVWELGDDFVRWIERRVTFYDTLVDRIVPGRPAGEAPSLPSGEPDEFPVQVEWFHSWYLVGPRDLLDVLPLDALDFNVSFVDDLRPYRELKVRILNGLHSLMAPVGLIDGLALVSEAVDHPEVGSWLRDCLEQEIAPTVKVHEADLAAFCESVWDRFRNPFIQHRLESILLNSSAKIPARIGEVVLERAASGRESRLMARGVAAWLWLARERELPDSAEVNETLNRLWASEISMGAISEHALQAPEILGRIDWPSSFAEAVAAELGAAESA